MKIRDHGRPWNILEIDKHRFVCGGGDGQKRLEGWAGERWRRALWDVLRALYSTLQGSRD